MVWIRSYTRFHIGVKMLPYIFNRLKERSTWLGLVGLICSAGVSCKPEHTEAIATVGTTVASLIAAIIPDKK